MLILPPFQRKGHGAQLLQSVYNDLTPDPRVLDITVEDPSDEFRALRDFVDCRNALAIECFRSPAVHEDFGGELERVCREKLKLHKKQARRVYEILRLRATDRSNTEQYTRYRLAIKNRLNGPYQASRCGDHEHNPQLLSLSSYNRTLDQFKAYCILYLPAGVSPALLVQLGQTTFHANLITFSSLHGSLCDNTKHTCAEIDMLL